MRIAYFIAGLKKEDGAVLVLLELVRQAQAKGHQCAIVTGGVEAGVSTAAEIILVPSFHFPLYKEYLIPLPGIKGFAAKLDIFKPDVVHIHSPETLGWAGVKYAKSRGVRLVGTHHTDFAGYLVYYNLSLLNPLVWYLLRKLYLQLDALTTTSSVTAADLHRNNIEATVVPWGVDVNRFNPSFRSEEFRKKLGKKILLCVCRLTWEKDLETLAQTYKLLEKKRQDFVLLVAGDGPQRQELQHLMPDALLLGHIEGQKLSEVFASADIFLFPSSRETFGNSTVEAMASGLAIIVANAGGSKALVESGRNGLLAEPKNAQQFFELAEQLLDNPEQLHQLQTAAFQEAQNYKWEKVFALIENIYNPGAKS